MRGVPCNGQQCPEPRLGVPATIAANLVCLCERHHRQLHHGDFTIQGDPEAGTLRFVDRFGRATEPPGLEPTGFAWWN